MPPDPHAPPQLSPQVEAQIRKVIASERAERAAALDALIKLTYPGGLAVRVFSSLRKSESGMRLAMEYVARIPGPIPAGLILLAAQALPDRSNPLPLRLTVAGQLLASVPDQAGSVGPIVRSVTAGLSRSKSLERMLQLQGKSIVARHWSR